MGIVSDTTGIVSDKLYDEVRAWTATSLFIVPILGLPRLELKSKGFINAFIKDEVRNIDYERGIFLLFRPEDLGDFEIFLSSVRKRAKVIDEYDYKNGHVMIVCQHDAKWRKDIETIMEGKFSKVSDEYKNNIPATVKVQVGAFIKEMSTLPHSIFNKDKSLINYWKDSLGIYLNEKEDEVWQFFPEREVFTQKILDTL